MPPAEPADPLPVPPAAVRTALARRMRTQGGACADLGSPLYAGLLAAAAGDIEAGGVTAVLLAGHEEDPGPSALALRMLGAVHRLVLTGGAPELARHYPSAGGRADAGPDAIWTAFRSTLEEHFDTLRHELDRPVQTNEVGRCAALLGGFLRVAAGTGLPLRLLEVGTSAGLNLRWDRYHYGLGGGWGPADSPVDLDDPFVGRLRPAAGAVSVAERAGCDRSPIDPTSAAGALTLESYVWPDMVERRRRLRGAIEVCRSVPAVLDRASAGEWLAARLARPAPGVATVVFHSVVMQYLTADERGQVAATLARAGAAATPAAPLAWLRMEPARRLMEVRLTVWPGGVEEHLADAGAHGRPVRWLLAPGIATGSG